MFPCRVPTDEAVFIVVTDIRKIQKRHKNGERMFEQPELAKQLYEFNEEPDTDEPSGYGYKLPEKPMLAKSGSFYDLPGIQKRHPGLPGRYSGFLEHFVQTGRG